MLVQEQNEKLQQFLRSNGLPQTLQSINSNKDIPNEVWAKIEEFQKKGAAQNFK